MAQCENKIHTFEFRFLLLLDKPQLVFRNNIEEVSSTKNLRRSTLRKNGISMF